MPCQKEKQSTSVLLILARTGVEQKYVQEEIVKLDYSVIFPFATHAPQSDYTPSDCCSSSLSAGSDKRPSSRLAAAWLKWYCFALRTFRGF